MNLKQTTRSEWRKKLGADASRTNWGRAAERLRQLPLYRSAAALFATPHDSLLQARVNCLIDGKDLLMPAPSLREGFYLLRPRSVPFKDLTTAVTYRGLLKFGRLLDYHSLSQLPVDLLLTDSLAVDREGGRLGEGDGFFDLSSALLHELGALGQGAAALTFIRDAQISPEPLPQDKWDLRMTLAVTPVQVIQFETAIQIPGIFRDMLTPDRIKRIDPLWKLYGGKPEVRSEE